MPNFSLLFLLFLLSSSPVALAQPDPSRRHFVLVHGACHGAWSWYKLATMLRSAGHNVTALDMAGAGADPRPAESLTSFSEYAEPLTEFMAELPSPERVILVGHSQGGFVISRAMEAFPDKISVAVFVAAAMPSPDLNASIFLREFRGRIDFGPDTRYIYGNGPTKPPTSLTFGPLFLASKMYQNTPAEDLTLAKTLMRAVRLFGEHEWEKDVKLSKGRYGSVKRVFICTEEDRVIKQNFQRWVIKSNPPNGVVQIRGSDHMPMLSKPFDLFNKLLHIAQHYS